MEKETKESVVAMLTIQKAGTRTPQERKQIAEWLRMQAETLLKEGKNYTEGRYVARFIYS